MKALILYDDFTCAAKTNAMLQHVPHRADVMVKWDIRPWRIDLLKFPSIADEALSSAADAHLIVFAVSRTPSVPVWLMTWLKRWAAIRQVPDVALAVISGGAPKPLLVPATGELCQFARRYGLSFIGDSHGETDDKPAILDHVPNERELSVSPPPPCCGNAPIDDIYRGWGIND
jgi:hypothetical protein